MNTRENEMLDIIREKHTDSVWSYDDEQSFGEKYGKVFSSALNNFFINSNEIAAALCASPETSRNMDEIAGCWIKVLAEQNASGIYDGRNEYSVKIGAKLSWHKDVKKLAEKEAGSYTPYDRQRNKAGLTYSFGMYAADYMSREHRTLQQSFSEIVFKYLKNRLPQLAAIDGNEMWQECPMY